MIAYLDSSVLVRAYLADEAGHQAARQLLEDSDADRGLVTGTWTRIEVSGALVRATRSGRARADRLLALLDADLGPDGRVSIVTAAQDQVEDRALELVRGHGLRALDAWHLAVALLVLPSLAEPGEVLAFASRDRAQADVAAGLGFQSL